LRFATESAAGIGQFEREFERGLMLLGTLGVVVAETGVDEAQVEARALGFRDGVGVNRHGATFARDGGMAKTKMWAP
jgi:hypothetical protein